MKEYETKFKAAKDKETQANKEYEDVLSNRKLSINEQLQRIKILATQHGREDIRAAAEQKSIDTLHRQLDASRNSMVQVQQRNDAVQDRLMMQRELHQGRVDAARAASGANDPAVVNAATLELVMNNKQPPKALYNAVYANLGQMAESQGKTIPELLASGADFHSQALAKRSFEIRAQNIERAENQLLAEIPVMEDAMKRLSNPKLPIAARGNIIALRALGNTDVTRMDQSAEVVLNEFEQVVTNSPGTMNVQDVQTAKETYAKIAAPQQMKAWIDGAKRIIGNAKKSIDVSRKETMGRMSGTMDAKGGGEAEKPAADASPQDIVKFYSERAEKVPAFKTMAAADEAGAAGLLKPGQRIKIKDKPATWTP